MTWATAAVLIIAILAVGEIVKVKYRARGGIAPDRRSADGPFVPLREEIALRREMEDLRERVKVLERITTDDRETKLLSAEIEKLREPQPKGDVRP